MFVYIIIEKIINQLPSSSEVERLTSNQQVGISKFPSAAILTLNINNMVSLSGTIEIIRIIKKTKAQFWKDIAVGDHIEFRLNIESNAKPDGCYQSYMTAVNKTTGEESLQSLHMVATYLKYNFNTKQIS